MGRSQIAPFAFAPPRIIANIWAAPGWTHLLFLTRKEQIMSQGTVFLPEPNPEDEREKVRLHEKPVFVAQKPGFTFWYGLFLTCLLVGLNILAA
jgi:hypothetical protein